jgi:hypothetical protein
LDVLLVNQAELGQQPEEQHDKEPTIAPVQPTISLPGARISGMKIETLTPLDIKAGDNGHEVLIRVSPQMPVKIVTLVFDNSTSSKQMNKIVSTLEDLQLKEITVTTN